MANFSLQIEPTDDNVYESLKNNTLGNNSFKSICLYLFIQNFK